MRKLTLQEALQGNRLNDFINQAERENVGPVSEADFNSLAERLIKTPQSDDQTSRSPRRDGSHGK